MAQSGSSDSGPSGDELPDLHPRIARQRAAIAEDYLGLLQIAASMRARLAGQSDDLYKLVAEAKSLHNHYQQIAYGHVERRKRPNFQRTWNHAEPPRKQFFLCIDECGSHVMDNTGELFPAFGIAGVLIDVERYQTFDRMWKGWKAQHLGSQAALMHEPDVRKRSEPFYRSDITEQQQLLASLDDIIRALDFTLIIAIIDKQKMREVYGDSAIDQFLPKSTYLIALDFILERTAHFLEQCCDDARGIIIAEARGPKEDAEVQHELSRLMLEGTQYISASTFRYQYEGAIRFRRKDANHSGLQVADLAPRPFAERTLGRSDQPERYRCFLPHLYDGMDARPWSYGFKIFPAPCPHPLEQKEMGATKSLPSPD